jgi:PAS domain S-box-containing protein
VPRSTIDLHHIVEAAGVIVFGILFYSYTYPWFPPDSARRRARALVNGVVFGLLALGLMLARIQIAPSVFIDARSVPIALVALFEGWPAALVSAVPGIVYRVSRGGAGAAAGVVGLVAVAVAGGLAHEWARREGGVRWRHSFALGAAVFLATLGSFALLGGRGLRQFGGIWLQYVGLYAIGIGLIARLLHDVGERARLAAAEARFRAIIDDASDAIRIVDPETLKIIDCNRMDCEISGYSRPEMIGRDIRDFWPQEPELRAQREGALAEAHAGGFARQFGLPARTRAGTIIRIDSTERLVEHGGRRYGIIVFRDAAARESLEQAQGEASELRAINLLATAAAHEINNPLTVVIGGLDLIGRQVPVEGRDRELIRQTIEAGLRIRDIVGRMTRITRVEAEPARGVVPALLDIRKSSDLP